MRRESHVRFSEGAGVRFPRATRLIESVKAECLDRIVLLGEPISRRPSENVSTIIIKNGRTRA